MEQTLYGDILFLVNFTMDFLSLYITGQILRRKMKTSFLALASAIGGAYGVAACFISLPVILMMLLSFGISLIMCYTVYHRRLLLPLSLFYGTSCLMGGAMTSFYGALNGLSVSPSSVAEGSRAFLNGIPPGWMAVMASAIAIAAIASGRIINKRRTLPDISLVITTEKGDFIFDALCDR